MEKQTSKIKGGSNERRHFKFDHARFGVCFCSRSYWFSLNTSRADYLDVEDFVSRFYELCLNRPPDPAGLKGWTEALLDGSQTGSYVAYGFVFSEEFRNKNSIDEEYLQVLYEAFFNREPDQAGWDAWLTALNSGKNRRGVLSGFIYSEEFVSLCQR